MISFAWPFVAFCAVIVLWRAVEVFISIEQAKARDLASRAELATLQGDTTRAAGVLAGRVSALEAQVAAISNHLQTGGRR